MSIKRHAVVAAALLSAAGAACGSGSKNGGSVVETPTSPDSTGNVFSGDAGVTLFTDDASTGFASPDANTSSTFSGPLAGPFSDFPSTALVDTAGTSAPANADQLFGPPSQGASMGGPCLYEPEVNSLYPNNWLRPRFAWSASGENLFELRLHVDNQSNDLVVHTTQTQWTMPKDMWDALRTHSQDVPMVVSVRGGSLQGTTLANEAMGSSGPLGIAPVGAPGTVVYWSIANQIGLLKGFSIGDESVIQVLTGAQVQERGSGGVQCVGCHAATPDGLNVGFAVGPSGYTDGIATIGSNTAPGGVPPFLSSDASNLLSQLHGVPAYSGAHWTTGDRMEILSDTGDLHWINLEASGAQVSGIIPRGPADTLHATTPTWSHDGTRIVYTSATLIYDGRPHGGPMDLFSLHYPAGGDATPVPGASDANYNEYYPAFSPDDKFVLFNRIPEVEVTYNNPDAELFVVNSTGGTPQRLAANDPACGKKSPGVTNSWAKWSPSAQTVPALGKTYYWIVFSSTRDPGGNPQLYISPIVVDASGTMTMYHSLYLWNQPAAEDNHTPAWDVFQIPPVAAPPPR